MLRALGISLSPEHIKAVQDLLPVLPQKLNDAWQIIHQTLSNFDQRLQRIEDNQVKILEVLNARRPADTGDTGDCKFTGN